MTRLEISICRAAMLTFKPHQPSVKTLWHSKMQVALDLMIEQVLNDKHVVPQVYRKLSLPTLLGLIGHCSTNLMVIGKKHSWMINARTSHKRHYIGTKQAIGLALRTVKTQLWERLETFAMRYASPGSTITVYCLHQEDSVTH